MIYKLFMDHVIFEMNKEELSREKNVLIQVLDGQNLIFLVASE